MTTIKPKVSQILIPTQIVQALYDLEQERKRERNDNSIHIDIILHVHGGDAFVIQDAWGKFRAAADFEDDDDLMYAVERLRRCENLLDD
jgi:glycosylphosphatidylinositol transamidase (GPIT) subunit GPI8